jgi:hypothetical protein
VTYPPLIGKIQARNKTTDSTRGTYAETHYGNHGFCFFSALVCSAQNAQYFPQVVDGISGSSGWVSGLGVANQGTSVASGTITFSQDNGTPFNISFKDELNNLLPSGNTIAFQIGPGQSKYFISRAAGALASGSATLTSNQPVVAGLVFEEFVLDAVGNATLIAEGGVAPAAATMQHVVFAIKNNNDSGIAVVNVGTGTATITFTLMDTTGATIVPSVNKNLGPNNHTAFLLSQLFPNAPQKVFGTLRITSTSPIAVTSLLIETGGQLGTLPIIQ